MKVEAITTPAHGVDLEELAQLHHDEFGCGRNFDVKAVARTVRLAVADPNRTYLNGWVAYSDEGKPIGYIVGSIKPNSYSFKNIASQEMWFVIPKYRKGLIAVLLLWHFERWAKERDCERIYTQVEHDNEPALVERLIKVMEKLGYKKQGYIAVKHISKEENVDDRTTHSEVGARQTA